MTKEEFLAHCLQKHLILKDVCSYFEEYVIKVSKRTTGVIIEYVLDSQTYIGSSYCNWQDEFNLHVGVYYAQRQACLISDDVLYFQPPAMRPFVQLMIDSYKSHKALWDGLFPQKELHKEGNKFLDKLLKVIK